MQVTATAMAVAGMLGLGAPALAATSTPDPDSSPVPLAGAATYRVVLVDEIEIQVGILAVARIPHATVVYYAIAPNQTGDADVFAMQQKSLSEPFPAMADADIDIVDVAHSALYQPLMSDGDCLCSYAGDLAGTGANGRPTVGYAVMPELPADLKTVTVQFGGHTFFPGIPVDDSPPSGTTVDAPVPLGQWPALPDEATVAAGDVKQATRPLTTRVADPVAATDTAPTRTTIALASDVLFATDHSDLNTKAQSAIQKVADKINERGSGTVSIDGYTDSVGTDAHNDALSKARARSVRAALKPLVSHPDVTFTTAGHGEQDPVADNGTAEGRQLNRRVTVSFATEEER